MIDEDVIGRARAAIEAAVETCEESLALWGQAEQVVDRYRIGHVERHHALYRSLNSRSTDSSVKGAEHHA